MKNDFSTAKFVVFTPLFLPDGCSRGTGAKSNLHGQIKEFDKEAMTGGAASI